MDSLQAPPGTTSGPAPPASSRRRLWPVWLIGLVIPALIASIIVYMANYEPLAVGGGVSSGDHTAKNLTDLDNSVRPYVYAQGQMTYVSVFLVNKGHWGVTVTDAERTADDFASLMSLVDLRLPTESNPIDPTASSFDAFSLGSRESQYIQLGFRFDHCDKFGAGSTTTFSRIRVHYRILGLPRDMWLDLPSGLWVKSPPDSACPARAAAR
jgi:hypothetical protein